jgi:hypothetical protein
MFNLETNRWISTEFRTVESYTHIYTANLLVILVRTSQTLLCMKPNLNLIKYLKDSSP